MVQCRSYHPFHYIDPKKFGVLKHDQCLGLPWEVMVLMLYDKTSLPLVSEVK